MPDKKDNQDEGSDFPKRFGDMETQRMIERAFLSEEVKARVTHVALKALGDMSPVCENCGELCDEHCVKLRDAFFRRAKFLVDKLGRSLDVYAQTRELGVAEPVDLVNMIYRIWDELSCLHDLVEPQVDEDEVAEEDSVEE